jgi:hypothetical protein
MPYSADITLATTQAFVNQVQMAMIKAAINVSTEARSTHNNIDFKRETLAKEILNNYSVWVTPFVYACVETGLTGTPTDAQVDTAVATVWNGIAGVLSTD